MEYVIWTKNIAVTPKHNTDYTKQSSEDDQRLHLYYFNRQYTP